jgi:hypothetical protein
MNAALVSTYSLIVNICLTGVVIGTLEFLAIAREFSPAGVYSWRILQIPFHASRASRIALWLVPIRDESGIRGLLIIRLIVLGLLFVAPMESLSFTCLMCVLVASNLIFTLRRSIGDDGSDQMFAIILITCLVCVGPHSDDFVLQCGLWFLAGQACLSYCSAGLSKLISPVWRSGDAIYKIFNTGTYGHEAVANLTRNSRCLRLVLCWSVIAVESLFPLALFLPSPYVWGFLIAGALFHFGCAVLMGLNLFVFAFVATYPAIYFVSSHISSRLWGG